MLTLRSNLRVEETQIEATRTIKFRGSNKGNLIQTPISLARIFLVLSRPFGLILLKPNSNFLLFLSTNWKRKAEIERVG